MIGQQKHRVVGVIAIAIVINAVAWIIYGLSIPIYTFHAVRQAHTAMVAYSLWKGGVALENCRLFFGGPNGTVIPFELPLYDATVALGYHLLGQHDVVAKGVAVIFASVACAMFVGLGKRLLPTTPSIYWLAAFLLPPTWIHHAQTVQPEATMMAIAVGMIFCSIKAYDSGRLGYAFLLWCLSVLGVCVKANEVFHLFLIPWALFFFGNRKRGYLFVPVIQLVTGGIAAYVWTQVGLKWPGATVGSLVWQQFFDFNRLLDVQSIGKAGVTMVLLLAPPGVLYLTGLGIRSLRTGSNCAEWKALGVAGAAYVLAGYPLYAYHTFYLNPLVPFVAAFSVKGLVSLLDAHNEGQRRRWALIGLIACSVPILILGTRLLYAMQTEQIVPAGQLAEKYSAVGEPLVVLDQSTRWSRAPSETRALYASKRFGWNITSDDAIEARESLREYQAKGAKTVLVLDYSPEFEPNIMRLFRSYRPAYTIIQPEELGLRLLEKNERYRISVWRIPEAGTF